MTKLDLPARQQSSYCSLAFTHRFLQFFCGFGSALMVLMHLLCYLMLLHRCTSQIIMMDAGRIHYYHRPEILRMSELNDNSELQSYSSAVLYILSAVSPPNEYVEAILDNFVLGIKSSTVKPFLVLTSPVLTDPCYFSPGVYVCMPYRLWLYFSTETFYRSRKTVLP